MESSRLKNMENRDVESNETKKMPFGMMWKSKLQAQVSPESARGERLNGFQNDENAAFRRHKKSNETYVKFDDSADIDVFSTFKTDKSTLGLINGQPKTYESTLNDRKRPGSSNKSSNR